MARYLLLMVALLFVGAALSAQTSLGGKAQDAESKEPILFAAVALYKNGVLITGTETDIDGNYNFSPVDPGTYDVEVSYVGYPPQKVTGVQVFAGKANKLDINMSSEAIDLDVVVITEYKVPLIEQDNTTSGATITSDQIKNLPTRNINALAATSAGLATADEGDDIAVRGARTNSTDYYVDGIRVRGNLLPESEIEQLQVITGGIEAQYGDVVGGIISITTKGPSSSFSGGIELETSRLLDPYEQDLVGFNLSGPILTKTDANGNKNSILGFRLSGRLTDQLDDDPPAVDIFRVKDDVLANLEANPIVVGPNGGDLIAADLLTNDDVEVLDYQPFEEYRRYDLVGKLDARLSKAVDVSLTGAYSDEVDRFTPGEASATGANWRVLNSHNNPYDYQNDYRLNFRLRHRLGGASGENAADGKGSLIQNASYTLQFGYEKNKEEREDSRHEDRLFDYGYIGQFDIAYIPSWNIEFDSLAPSFFKATHVDNQRILTGYVPDPNINPVLANYNNVLDIQDGENLPTTLDEFKTINGDVQSVLRSSWDFHSNVGSVNNQYRKRDNDTYTFKADASFDLIPGSSDKGRHNIQLGIWYEQRTNREWDINPRALWQLARQLQNNNIEGIPFDEAGNPLTDTIGLLDTVYILSNGQLIPFFSPINGLPVPGALLDVAIDEGAEDQFFRSIRQITGQGLNEFVNVDALRPDQLSLDMFSAKELNDYFVSGDKLLDYYGYTYTGELFDGTFDDFFTATDPVTGIRTFPIAPNRPIYTAAYVQDKFTFKDIIFRLGVRVDRYDANTRVLKDNYSLYEIIGAGDYHNQFGGERPGSIGDDFKVYASDASGETVFAYRDGDQWYRPNGNPVNNAAEIFQGSVVNPVYKDERVRDNINFIQTREFDPNVSFEDYEVQVNIMPRLAFSFPISDEANFFAHYDVLVQRPPSNTIATPADYYYFLETSNTIKNNPNLKPMRTIDYEVGFQQKLSNTSAIKLAAYYKEMRDMIQVRTFFPVPVIGQYTTYDNQDFGTVKGFTFQYDLRRTGNVSFNANYTLQFADGTGSDADSQRNLSSRGNLRTLFPLNFDERHRIVANIDYRYASGNKYTGPTLFGADILSNFGINLQTIAVSGRPYTAKLQATQLSGQGTIGSINGARNPWNFTLNLRVDKSFDIGKNLGLNVYVRVSNLLDRQNIIQVYPATGSAVDDGFLATPEGRSFLNGLDDLQEIAFLASYQWRELNPNFYSLPRRIYLGAIFDF
ncbi:MAG TPA: TonB-dependent receptor [Saprospiraceae bacterium]|nr:TonB-dependent receptor [Saprospiraceae bacterium]HMQ84782.1 TonB-dependent receptor [Saprospiraceae bacterium]